MAAPHVCILQTSFAKREDTIAFLKEKVPGVRVAFITDSIRSSMMCGKTAARRRR